MKLITLIALIILLIIGCNNDNPIQPSTPIFSEVVMECMDKVSIGGVFQAVINTQPQFDSLWYARFQKPLDDWREQNYPSILASVKRDYPGLTDSQYVQLAEDRLYNYYPFKGTRNCTKPIIDFTKYTLLGQDANGGGCTTPTYQISFSRDDSQKRIVFSITILRHGSCSMAFIANKWILTSKIPESFIVIFQKKYLNE